MSKKYWVLLLFFFIGGGLYSNSLWSPFYFDDVHTIKLNPYVHNLSLAFEYFVDSRTHSTIPMNSSYRPFLTLTYAVLWKVGGGTPVAFHVYKIIIHVLITWLIFLVAGRLLESSPPLREKRLGIGFWRLKYVSELTPNHIAFLGALFFLVHPGLSESVNYISSLSSQQSVFFYLFAFLMYLKAVESLNFPRVLLMLGSLLLALFTKEIAITFFAALILHQVFFRDERSEAARFLIYISIAVTVVFLLCYFGFRHPDAVNVPISRYLYLLNQIWVWVYYILWIFMPWGYSIDHTNWISNQNWYELKPLLGMTLSLGLLLLAARFALSKKAKVVFPFLGFAVFWHYLTLMPSSSVVVLAELVNEHRYLLSYTLLFPAIFYFFFYVTKKINRPLIFGNLFLVFLIFISLRTHYENYTWADEVRLWKKVIANAPNNGRAHNNLGNIYLAREEHSKAYQHYKACNKIWPEYALCYLNQHLLFSRMNNPKMANWALDEAIRLEPNRFEVQYYQALRLVDRNKTIEAERLLRVCVKNSENKNVPCIKALANTLKSNGKMEEYFQVRTRQIFLEPENRAGAFQLGLELIGERRYDQAQLIYQRLYLKNPNDGQVLYNLAWVEMKRENWVVSKNLWKRVLEIAPDSKNARSNLEYVESKSTK